jgi:hypothetical protein
MLAKNSLTSRLLSLFQKKIHCFNWHWLMFKNSSCPGFLCLKTDDMKALINFKVMLIWQLRWNHWWNSTQWRYFLGSTRHTWNKWTTSHYIHILIYLFYTFFCFLCLRWHDVMAWCDGRNLPLFFTFSNFGGGIYFQIHGACFCNIIGVDNHSFFQN